MFWVHPSLTGSLETDFKSTIFSTHGCSTVGRAVDFNARDARFEYSHGLFLFTVNCTEKTKIKKKYAYNCPFLDYFKYTVLIGAPG